MGNLCSRPSKQSDPFSHPGRSLHSAEQPSAPRPAAAPSRGGPAKSSFPASSGRTLGGGGGGGGGGGEAGGEAAGETDAKTDARTNAAMAAQKRAEAASTSNKGKLGSKLAAQKAQTQSSTLNEASRDERAARDADGAAAARRWE